MIEHPSFFLNKIKKKEPFAFVRYGDGEIIMIRKEGIMDCLPKFEFYFDPKDSDDILLSKLLYESLTYIAEGYYIGFLMNERKSLTDPKNRTYRELYMEMINQKNCYWVDHDIFVGALAYKLFWFLEKFFNLVKENKNLKINWICHEDVKKAMPCYINKFFFVETNCWKVHREEAMKEVIDYAKNVENELFMFSAGPLSNILIHRLWKEYRTNMYMNVGSTFSYFCHDIKTRSYFRRKELEKNFEYYKERYFQFVNMKNDKKI